MQMNPNILPRTIEVAFCLYIDRLFKTYTQPTLVFRYLDACCQMFSIDRTAFQILIVKVMKEERIMQNQLKEYIRVLKASGANSSEVVRRSGIPARTAWRIYSRTVDNYTPVLQYSAEERVLMSQFLTEARRIGGML